MKKFFALLLALTMVLQLCPFVAIAEGTAQQNGFQSMESNNIESADVEEAFEVIFDWDDTPSEAQQESAPRKLFSFFGGNGRQVETKPEPTARPAPSGAVKSSASCQLLRTKRIFTAGSTEPANAM